eukprot:COSAG01_NODE_7495_length_3184_cov_3.188006_1_plen_712_part_00
MPLTGTTLILALSSLAAYASSTPELHQQWTPNQADVADAIARASLRKRIISAAGAPRNHGGANHDLVTMKCPPGVNRATEPGKAHATVTLEAAVLTEVGARVTVRPVSPRVVSAVHTPRGQTPLIIDAGDGGVFYRFHIGRTVVPYTVQDSQGGIGASCTVVVEVVDAEPPQIMSGCPPVIDAATDRLSLPQIAGQLNVTDNSGEPVSVRCSCHSSRSVAGPPGSCTGSGELTPLFQRQPACHLVRCEVSDGAGNLADPPCVIRRPGMAAEAASEQQQPQEARAEAAEEEYGRSMIAPAADQLWSRGSLAVRTLAATLGRSATLLTQWVQEEEQAEELLPPWVRATVTGGAETLQAVVAPLAASPGVAWLHAQVGRGWATVNGGEPTGDPPATVVMAVLAVVLAVTAAVAVTASGRRPRCKAAPSLPPPTEGTPPTIVASVDEATSCHEITAAAADVATDSRGCIITAADLSAQSSLKCTTSGSTVVGSSSGSSSGTASPAASLLSSSDISCFDDDALSAGSRLSISERATPVSGQQQQQQQECWLLHGLEDPRCSLGTRFGTPSSLGAAAAAAADLRTMTAPHTLPGGGGRGAHASRQQQLIKDPEVRWLQEELAEVKTASERGQERLYQLQQQLIKECSDRAAEKDELLADMRELEKRLKQERLDTEQLLGDLATAEGTVSELRARVSGLDAELRSRTARAAHGASYFA